MTFRGAPATSVKVMGQPVVVSQKPTRDPRVVRFEANRLFTGSGHERYTAVAGVGRASTPTAMLAGRLFAAGKASAVHAFGNLITVELVAGQNADGLEPIIRDLYQYWKPGMEPPSFENYVAEEVAAPVAASSDGAAPAGDPRVPAHLIERAAAARARLAAKG